MDLKIVHLFRAVPTGGIVVDMEQQINCSTWVGKFRYSRSNLMNGLGPIAREAQKNHAGVGTLDSQHMGMIRVAIHPDRTATCILDLKVNGRVVYTAAVETGELVSSIGTSRVFDTVDAVRFILSEVFGYLTQEMQDLDGLAEWTYYQIYGRPMRGGPKQPN